MSSEPLINLRGVGKTFQTYSHPAGRLMAALSSRYAGEAVKALSSIDLVTTRGECVGIVGRNGAGKSTLLQIISGVMQPTAGTVETRGRIAAMLQLGAGFNGEFTGRQNVRLTAAIYGLGPSEIEARMASIENFAGIGDRIDRPVREYSSGMFARLAFAVCAHVDPDIIVVDEILGVGDAEFQQRSMRFLRQFRRKGIVLFVSHDEHAVSALCSRAIWIEAGRLVADGPARPVLRQYRRHMAGLVAGSDPQLPRDEPAPADLVQAASGRLRPFDPDDPPAPAAGAKLLDLSVTAGGVGRVAFAGGEIVEMAVSAMASAPLDKPRILVLVRNPMGQVVFELDSRREGHASADASVGDYLSCRFRFRLPYLPSGVYSIDVLATSSPASGERLEALAEAAATLRMVSSHVSGGLANIRMDSIVFEAKPVEVRV